MNNCFVYPVYYNSIHITDFIRSIRYLQKHYLNKYPTDIICFHERTLDQRVIDNIKDILPTKLIWQLVDIDKDNDIIDIKNNIPIDYLNMLRFKAFNLVHQPILDKYKKYCLLDTDSFIIGDIKDDIFNNGLYCYNNNTIYEHPDFIIDFYEKIEDIITKYNIPTKLPLSSLNKGQLFYTNFEVVDIEWFRNNKYYKIFKDELRKDIYKYRWSDCLVRYVLVNLLMDKQDIIFKDIPYSHQAHGSKNEIYSTNKS